MTLFVKLLVYYLLIINAAAFVLMLVDKYKAQNNLWRIPEATLMLVAALGGSFAMIVAMKTVRHKTRHIKFVVGVPLILIVQVVIGTLLFHYLH